MKENKKILPKYSFGEDMMNAITHLLGCLFAVIVLVLFLVFEIKQKLSISTMYPLYIYVLFMGIMFSVSVIYHTRKHDTKSRYIWRKIDHSNIYFYVAATYTPVCVFYMSQSILFLIILILEWSFALFGSFLTAFLIDNKVARIISYILYIIMGWALALFFPAIKYVDLPVFLFLLGGGIVYTLGVIFYSIGKKRKWFHSIFHLFILLADILQFVGIWLMLINTL